MDNPFSVMKEKPADYFNLIPQTGVTHLLCTDDPQHNAIWDMAVSPEGRVFFSVCGESYQPLYARLYEYDYANKKLIRHFALEDKLVLDDISLHTSKFHTALSFIGDGKILATTHTTSPGKNHPTWMPYEYAGHPYEGYQGSHLLIYNYQTGECNGLGVISPHDTTYGATYDPKNGDYFCTTWMRGIGYVYNVHTGEHRCLGQVTDAHTSRTFLCSDGHIYGSTYSGVLFRYNTDIRDIEYLDVEAPGLIRHAREYNGVLYFTTGPCSVPGRGQMLHAYDLQTRKLTDIGRPVPLAEPKEENSSIFHNAYGMAFDSKGRLWYGCMTFIPEHRYVGARLFMWDFLNGREPVDCGFLGTPKRTISITAEMHIVNDILIISDGNHTSDCDTPCGILAIDLEEFVPALETEKRIASHDYVNYLPYPAMCAQWYPKGDWDDCMARYQRYYKDTIQYFLRFGKENAYRYPFEYVSGVSVWQKTGRQNSAIQKIIWKSDTQFVFWCGKHVQYMGVCSVNAQGQAHLEELKEQVCPAIDACSVPVPEVRLPAVPGRRYLAVAESGVELSDGSIVVGTQDTMLAKITGNNVYSLGQVCTAGGIHGLCVDKNDKVWGIAGHPEGVGQLFTFDKISGVTLLGMVPEAWAENGRNVSLYRPTALAINPGGQYLAIGGADEIGGIVVLKL